MIVALLVLIAAFVGVTIWGFKTGYIEPGLSVALAVIGVAILIVLIARLIAG